MTIGSKKRPNTERRRSSFVGKPEHRTISRLFSSSLMSNEKWRKLVHALDDLNLFQAIFKFIDVDEERRMAFPKSHAFRGKSYIDSFDGPFALSEIEWMEIPGIAEYERSTPSRTGRIAPLRRPQDLDRIREILSEVGKFPIEETERGIRIIGHVRR